MDTEEKTLAAGAYHEFHMSDQRFFMLLAAAEGADVELQYKSGRTRRARAVDAGYFVEVRGDDALTMAKVTNVGALTQTVKVGYTEDFAGLARLLLQVTGGVGLRANPSLGTEGASTVDATGKSVLAANTDRARGSTFVNYSGVDVWVRYNALPDPASNVGYRVGPGGEFDITCQLELYARTASGTADYYISEEEAV
jgi:hypothetical protein